MDAASGGSTSPDDFQFPPSPPDDLGEILAFTDLQTFGLSLAGGQRAGYIEDKFYMRSLIARHLLTEREPTSCLLFWAVLD